MKKNYFVKKSGSKKLSKKYLFEIFNKYLLYFDNIDEMLLSLNIRNIDELYRLKKFCEKLNENKLNSLKISDIISNFQIIFNEDFFNEFLKELINEEIKDEKVLKNKYSLIKDYKEVYNINESNRISKKIYDYFILKEINDNSVIKDIAEKDENIIEKIKKSKEFQKDENILKQNSFDNNFNLFENKEVA